MHDRIGHFVGGERAAPRGSRVGEIYDPARGVVIAHCAFADSSEVDAAVRLADEAARRWGRESHARRMSVIFGFRTALLKHKARLMELISLEHGKTALDAEGEIGRSLEALEFATNAPHLMKGSYLLNIGGGIDNFSINQPLGVVACIAPFNFPVMVPVMMGTMAVACGNAVVLKPSERVPSAALLLAELWMEAGLPKGVFSVINGDKAVVDHLLEHELIRAVSFVGSTGVGEYVYRKGTSLHKRVAAFTGGKNQMIILPDADIEQASAAFVNACYGSASQRCMAIAMAIPVGERAAEEFIEATTPKVRALRPGHFQDAGADFGPLITRQAKDSVVRHVNQSLQEGARLLVDGREATVKGFENGFFLGATLLDNVSPKSAFYLEEVFGPARAVVRADDVECAIRLVNGHQYGNGVALYTRDGYEARRFFEEVEVGAIGINVPIPVPAGCFSFGGLKRSRFGDAHLFGPDAVRFFTKSKVIAARWRPDGTFGMAMPTHR